MKYTRHLPESPRDYAYVPAKGATLADVALAIVSLSGCFFWVCLLLGMNP